MALQIILPNEPSNEDVKVIYKGLLAFNTEMSGAPENKPFVALLREIDTGETLGGLHSYWFYGWFYIAMLFVPEALRGQGYGMKLMKEAEKYARSQNSCGIWLDTYSFQAPAFYEKAGYEKFGELPDFPAGHSRVFYRKILVK
jgi:GNAT superfamily N-acetyltransferase